MGQPTCRKCGLSFPDVAAQREHFKSPEHPATLSAAVPHGQALGGLPSPPPLLSRVSSHESSAAEEVEATARRLWQHSPVASLLLTAPGSREAALGDRLTHVHKALLPADFGNFASVLHEHPSLPPCIAMPTDVLTGGPRALWAVLLFRSGAFSAGVFQAAPPQLPKAVKAAADAALTAAAEEAAEGGSGSAPSSSVSGSDAQRQATAWATLSALDQSADVTPVDLVDVAQDLVAARARTLPTGEWPPHASHHACGHTCVLHKTMRAYTNRSKQGGAQSRRDNTGGGRPRSIGSQMRRANEVHLAVKVHELLASWRPLLDRCSHIFIGASKGTVGILHGSGGGMPDSAAGRLTHVHTYTPLAPAAVAAAAAFDALPGGQVWRPPAAVAPPPLPAEHVAPAEQGASGATAVATGDGSLPLPRTDPRIRRIPFVTKKPSHAELLSAYRQLRRAWVSRRPRQTSESTPASKRSTSDAAPAEDTPTLLAADQGACGASEPVGTVEAGAGCESPTPSAGVTDARADTAPPSRSVPAAQGSAQQAKPKSKGRGKKRSKKKRVAAPVAAPEEEDDDMAALEAAVAANAAATQAAHKAAADAAARAAQRSTATAIAAALVAALPAVAPAESGVLAEVVLAAAERSESDTDTALATARMLCSGAHGAALDVPGVFMALGWEEAAAVAAVGAGIETWSALLV